MFMDLHSVYIYICVCVCVCTGTDVAINTKHCIYNVEIPAEGRVLSVNWRNPVAAYHNTVH